MVSRYVPLDGGRRRRARPYAYAVKGRCLLLIALAAMSACAAPRTAARPTTSGAPSAALSIPSVVPTERPLQVAVTSSKYGALSLATSPGAQCSAEVHITPPDSGDAPVTSLPATPANASGTVAWSYATPRVPHSAANYWISCTLGASSVTETATFDVSPAALLASALAVRISTATPPQPSYTPDASLVPLRDAVASRLRTTLADEWNKATRSLGHIRVVDESPDLTVYVIAALGTSVHRKSPRDGSEDIEIFVNDVPLGEKITVENAVATTLHELGHVWCCFGPDGDGAGHWRTPVRDAGLYGVDKYGLMNDPVKCFTFGAVLSCPNRFSDREMRALGFDSFPPPVLDPCVTHSRALQSQLDPLLAQLDTLSAQIEAGKSRLAGLSDQIKAIESQNPYGIPPSIYPSYQSLITQYNALVAQVQQQIDQYNAPLARAKALEAQINGLPCDAS